MNQKSARLALLIVLFASISSALAQQSAKPVSLAGEWRFSMDRDDKGMGEKWFGKNLDAHIKLPGILQSQGYGDEITVDTKWIAALPRGTASVTKNSDNTLSLHSCDPGAGAKVVTNRSVAAYGLLLFRDQLIDEFIQQGAEPDLATCASDAVTAVGWVAGVNAGQAPPVLNNPTAFAQIIQTCRATSGTVVAHDEIDN